MLGVRKYTRGYLNSCRSRVEADVSAFNQVARRNGAIDNAGPDDAMEAFEATFFNDMVLVLDHLFVHRLRTVEGKDGNALNEVRVLADSLMENNGVMKTDKSIKLSTESVLNYRPGDEIRLREAEFLQLSEAFFSEIEARYL